jgi:hypothetical protein
MLYTWHMWHPNGIVWIDQCEGQWKVEWIKLNVNYEIFCNINVVQMGQMYHKYWISQFKDLIWIY